VYFCVPWQIALSQRITSPVAMLILALTAFLASLAASLVAGCFLGRFLGWPASGLAASLVLGCFLGHFLGLVERPPARLPRRVTMRPRRLGAYELFTTDGLMGAV
jgi:hypothetical protein